MMNFDGGSFAVDGAEGEDDLSSLIEQVMLKKRQKEQGGDDGMFNLGGAAGGAAGGAMTGASIGAAGGPIGMAGGAALGGLAGLFS